MAYHPKNEQEKIVHRLKIARGHLEKVIKMAEDHEYCIDLIHQSQAVQKALKETDSVILENHLNSCVAEAIKKGNQEETIQEVMNVFRRKQ